MIDSMQTNVQFIGSALRQPPQRLSSAQLWIQVFKSVTAADATSRQQMAAILRGLLPSPFGLSIKTVRAWAQTWGNFPISKHFSQRTASDWNACGESLAKFEPCQPSGPAALPFAACSSFQRVVALGKLKWTSDLLGTSILTFSQFAIGSCNQILFHCVCKCSTWSAGSSGSASSRLLFGPVVFGRFNQVKILVSDSVMAWRREAWSAAPRSRSYCCTLVCRAETFHATAGSVSSGHLCVTHFSSRLSFFKSSGLGFNRHSLMRRINRCSLRSAVICGKQLLFEKGVIWRGGTTMPLSAMLLCFTFCDLHCSNKDFS